MLSPIPLVQESREFWVTSYLPLVLLLDSDAATLAELLSLIRHPLEEALRKAGCMSQ